MSSPVSGQGQEFGDERPERGGAGVDVVGFGQGAQHADDGDVLRDWGITDIYGLIAAGVVHEPWSTPA
jgi:hypothetical protein